MKQFTQEYLNSSIERIKSKVVIDDNLCWIWQGAKSSDGYAAIWFNNYTWRGNRLMCFITYGEPKNRLALHSCDNPTCINPEHLRWGSHKDNNQDMVARLRSVRGSKNAGAKLSENQVIEIRNKLNQKQTMVYLANVYGVSLTTIKRIKYNLAWKID